MLCCVTLGIYLILSGRHFPHIAQHFEYDALTLMWFVFRDPFIQ